MPRISRSFFGNLPLVTTLVDGLMAHTDKSKLDGIAAAATANSTVVVAPITNGGSALNPSIGISAATSGAAGSMSAADKAKLDGIASGATYNPATDTGLIGLTGDVGLTANVWYPGPAMTFGAGTWLVWGVAVCSAGGAAGFDAGFYNGLGGPGNVPNNPIGEASISALGEVVSIPVGPIVTTGTTWTLMVMANTGATLKRVAVLSGGLATFIRAVRLA